MIGKNINSSRPVCLAEAKHILEERAKDGALQFEQQGSLDYCTKFAHLGPTQAKHLVQELSQVSGKLTEEAISRIIDLMPKYRPQLSLILMKEKIELGAEEFDKILALTAPFAQKYTLKVQVKEGLEAGVQDAQEKDAETPAKQAEQDATSEKADDEKEQKQGKASKQEKPEKPKKKEKKAKE
ncbi:hypothetical protein FJZ26_00940 [Candidatus Parvarchaeota archaeon]|nr:hypothetical protein [Candidatus Parvarchaeota archaeon]